jgi:excisionase family DNA binding protein
LADDLLSLGEAAALTGLSASHLRLLASSGRIRAQKVGRNWITTEAAVRAYLADRRQGARGPYRRSSG